MINEIDRYTRSRWLFDENFSKLQNAKVLVCGCGGVGGVCIDALMRSGIVNMSIIDCDVFDITNQNRQIYSENVGKNKVDVFKEIYPSINAINIRLSPQIIEEIDFNEYDVIIDAIDDVPSKVALALKTSKKLISSMGGAKRLDPTAIKVASIWKTINDPFAKKIRYELKKAGFKGDYKVVFSTELPNCTKLGSFMGVTASFGLMLASLAIKQILSQKS